MQHLPKPKHGRCAAHRPLDAKHDFDPVSGHCIHGCGNCDDGRIVNMLTGSTFIPGATAPDELDWTNA